MKAAIAFSESRHSRLGVARIHESAPVEGVYGALGVIIGGWLG